MILLAADRLAVLAQVVIGEVVIRLHPFQVIRHVVRIPAEVHVDRVAVAVVAAIKGQ